MLIRHLGTIILLRAAVGELDPKQRRALVETMMQETGKSAEEVQAVLDAFLEANPNHNEKGAKDAS